MSSFNVRSLLGFFIINVMLKNEKYNHDNIFLQQHDDVH
jgi:hypothetical protein